VFGVAVLLRHHIHVALQDHSLGVFVALAGRYTYHEIAYTVTRCFKTLPGGPLPDPGNDLLFVLGGAGDFSDFVEVIPDYTRFQIGQGIAHRLTPKTLKDYVRSTDPTTTCHRVYEIPCNAAISCLHVGQKRSSGGIAFSGQRPGISLPQAGQRGPSSLYARIRNP